MASINRGDNTGAFGKEFLRIYLNNPNNLEITKAVIHINRQMEKIYDYPVFPLKVNFTGEETYLLKQDNTCTLAVWDGNGRRRTAEGKFTFFVKQNCIHEPDSPYTVEEPEEPGDSNENDLVFDLDDSEFAAKFQIDCSPSKMSELEMDVDFLQADQILGGRNVTTRIDEEGNVIINANSELSMSYDDLTDKPMVNGQILQGNITVECDQVNADWNAFSGVAQILNKPEFHQIAFSGQYDDLEGIPPIPTKLSQLENDTKFITKEVKNLDNYYRKQEVDYLLGVSFDTEPIYDAIGNVQSNVNHVEEEYKQADVELENKIDELDSSLKGQINSTKNSLQNKIDENSQRISDLENKELDYVSHEELLQATADKLDGNDKQELLTELQNKVDRDDFTKQINSKADKSSIGKGNLFINVNDASNTFNANSDFDVTVDITIPKKISDLENDEGFITKSDVDTNGLVTKEQLNQAISDKATIDEIGHAQITLTKNEEQIGVFSANAKKDQTIDISVPTKMSELEIDIDMLKPEDVTEIKETLKQTQESLQQKETEIRDVYTYLGDKVDKATGKDLLSTAEIERLKTLYNYDDTELRGKVNTNTQNITDLQDKIDSKVTAEEGKGLSSNDFTSEYQTKIDDTKNTVDTLEPQVTQQREDIDINKADIVELKNKDTSFDTQLKAEIQKRETDINELKEQLEGMTAKATVVDIVATEAELRSYPTKNLLDGDVICVLSDETKDYTTTYYRWSTDAQYFNYVGSEGVYYTKSQADRKFALKEYKINGHPLEADVEITAGDVGALPEDTVIGNGKLTIQRNKEQVGTFDANTEENVAVNLEVPVKVSELENDASYATTYALDSQREELDEQYQRTVQEVQELKDKVDTFEGVITGDVGGLAKVAFTNQYSDLDGLPTIPTDLSQLNNDCGFITSDKASDMALEDVLESYATKEDLPGKVSELENDRGYLTNNALGRGILTVTINGESFEGNTWMANEKYDQTMNIPATDELNAESNLPITSKAVQGLSADVLHLGEDQTITGNDTFEGHVTLKDAEGVTPDTADNSTKLATTEYVQNQDYCTNTDAVHKTGDESISGTKTFSNVSIKVGTSTTVQLDDNSDNIATTKFVKNQNYCTDTNLVHKTDDEDIHGNKTFHDTITFTAITDLGSQAKAATPDEQADTFHTGLVTNVEYVQQKIKEASDEITKQLKSITFTDITAGGTVPLQDGYYCLVVKKIAIDDTTKEQYTQKINGYNTTLTPLKEKIDGLDISTQLASVETLKSGIAQAQTDITSHETAGHNITTVQATLDELSPQITQLDTDAQALNTKITDAKSKAGTIKTNIDDATTKLEKLTIRQTDEFDTTLEQINTDIESLTTTSQEIDSTLTTIGSSIETLTQSLTALQEAITALGEI